jgi:dihydroxy-acid dehydratase
MSGTYKVSSVLHVAPESFVGGPLALLRTGDIVRLDLPNRTLDMLVDEAELAARRAAWVAPEPRYQRGWGYLYQRHVGQADQGCDFDFLTREQGRAAGEPAIY